jgi:hypothetical protein
MQTHYLHELTIHNASLGIKRKLRVDKPFLCRLEKARKNGGHLEVHLVDAQWLQMEHVS